MASAAFGRGHWPDGCDLVRASFRRDRGGGAVHTFRSSCGPARHGAGNPDSVADAAGNVRAIEGLDVAQMTVPVRQGGLDGCVVCRWPIIST